MTYSVVKPYLAIKTQVASKSGPVKSGPVKGGRVVSNWNARQTQSCRECETAMVPIADVPPFGRELGLIAYECPHCRRIKTVLSDALQASPVKRSP